MTSEGTIQSVRLPLVGRACARVTVGMDITNDHTVLAYIMLHPGDAIVDAVVSKSSVADGIIVTDAPREIFFDLTDDEAADLSPNRLYNLLVTLVDASDAVVHAIQFNLIPVNRYVQEDFPLTGVAVLLSTRFINTLALLGEAGGAGYLDGVTTVGQPAGCVVQFTPVGLQPQQWTLIAGADATEAGAKRRGLDWVAGTPLYWLRNI